MKPVDLFDASPAKESNEPLAYRMRPRKIDDIVGQDDILGEGKLLRRAITFDKIGSIILYGPPGSGKTSIAEVIAATTGSEFVRLNAVTSGVVDIRRVVDEAKDRLKMYGKNTILFVDEIHRFNRSQQDALLPHVENGTVTLIGATTENPYFEVNAPLLSRSRIFRLKALESQDIKELLIKAVCDKEYGIGEMDVCVAEDALEHLADFANGDARSALNALELAACTTSQSEDGKIHISLDIAIESIQRRALGYSDGGDSHYDVISAFIKSMRGSNPDAALHYLARMIEAGEDPKFIARRLIVHASEDVGMADPSALLVAVAAFDALERVGLPEARLALAQATIHIATAPKSNSVLAAIDSAMNDIRNKRTPDVPLHLRSAEYKGAKELSHGIGYKYPHNYDNAEVEQQYMPDALVGTSYYNPTERDRVRDKYRSGKK